MNFVDGLSTREAYGKALLTLGEQDPAIVVLDADLSRSTMTALFAERFPERFFDTGVAEQNMVGTAAGLATVGKVPFLSTFAVFGSGRVFDQLRMCVAYPRLNVKVAVSHSGLTVGEDGASHQAIEDVALLRCLPGFAIVVPADDTQAAWATNAAAEHVGPVYLRLGRPRVPRVYPQGARFRLGKAHLARPGRDVTVVANGTMLVAALEAAEGCAAAGVDVRVLDLHTVKPLDREAIVAAARETGAIVVAEEHLLSGGTGSAVGEVLVEECPVPTEFVALRDTYAESGKPAELLARYGLTATDIAAAVRRVLERKLSAGVP